MKDYISRARALVVKLEQNNMSATKKEINRRILNGLACNFDVEKNMFLLMIDTDPDALGEALARVEDSRTSNGGGIHALVTRVKPRGGGPRRDRGGRGNAGGRRDGKGHQPHHHQQQWAPQPLVRYQQQWASQPPAQQQQPLKHQRQPQQQQRPGEGGTSRHQVRRHHRDSPAPAALGRGHPRRLAVQPFCSGNLCPRESKEELRLPRRQASEGPGRRRRRNRVYSSGGIGNVLFLLPPHRLPPE